MQQDTMEWLRRDRRNWFVMAVAGWEFATLAFPKERYRWLPVWWEPWTRYFWRWREHRWQRLGLWILLGWLTEHCFGENRCMHHPGGCPGLDSQDEAVFR